MTFGIAKRPVTGCFVIVAMWFLFTAILMNGCEIVFVGQMICVNDSKTPTQVPHFLLFTAILKFPNPASFIFHLD